MIVPIDVQQLIYEIEFELQRDPAWRVGVRREFLEDVLAVLTDLLRNDSN